MASGQPLKIIQRLMVHPVGSLHALTIGAFNSWAIVQVFELLLFDISRLFIRIPVADATAAVAEAKWNVAIEDSKEVVMVSKTGH